VGCGGAPAAPGAVAVWLTTPDLDSAVSRQADVTPQAPGGAADVWFDDTAAQQPIDGFGAAFTDTSASLIAALPAAARAALMQQLFSRPDGVGLSFMRVPMGSSDFAACECPYSYDDGAADPTLAGFSTAHDDAAIIPVIRQAQALNPQMKLFANPWSPPAWMKTNGSMLGGGDGALRDDARAPLAQYFVRFLQDYAAKGVSVWAITPQNEPSIAPGSYAGMLFPAADEAAWIATELAPALRAAGLGAVGILGGDDVGAFAGAADALFAGAAPDLAGTAWHCYAGLTDMTAIHAAHPDSPLYTTECSTGPTGIAGDTSQQTLAALQNWARGVALWNLALDPSGGPKMGEGCTGCTGLVTVDPAAGTYQFTINYYELAQFARFIAPGATRVATGGGGGGVTAQAFRNPDGTDVLVAFNPGAAAARFTVDWSGRGTFAATLPAGATVTFSTNQAHP
jgi:glucosylceramidase